MISLVGTDAAIGEKWLDAEVASCEALLSECRGMHDARLLTSA